MRIAPFAGGDKIPGPGDTTTSAVATPTLQITDYSRTWNVTGLPGGATKQADLFLTFQDEGVFAYNVSVRFDGGGANMLNFLALHEYNMNVGEQQPYLDHGLGPTSPCEPVNNFTDPGVMDNLGIRPVGQAHLERESPFGQAGYLYRFGGTVRVGSVLFELNKNTGTSSVTIGAFLLPGAIDSVVTNAGILSVPDPDTILVIPEPGSAVLLSLSLLVLALAPGLRR